MPEVIRSIDIQASPGAVWQWLATEDALRRWLSPDLDIDLREGGTYRMRGADEKTAISGAVLELVPKGAWSFPGWKREATGCTRPGCCSPWRPSPPAPA